MDVLKPIDSKKPYEFSWQTNQLWRRSALAWSNSSCCGSSLVKPVSVYRYMLPLGTLLAVKGLNLWWRKLYFVAGSEHVFEWTWRSCGYNSPCIAVRFNETCHFTLYCLKVFFFLLYNLYNCFWEQDWINHNRKCN